MSEINFIDYDKISIQSDAFVTSEDLSCYFQYIPSTKALSYNIKKEKHTAGTTEDPNDYKVPDVKDKLSPKKLYRINPFHKNYAEQLHLHKTNVDPEIIFPTITKEIKEVENDYSDMGLNQDQIDFLLALKNLKNLKVEDVSKKLDIDQFEITEEKLMEGFFQLYPRYMEQLVSSSNVAGNLNYDDELEQESFVPSDSEQSMINYHLKKLGFNPDDTKVKKNFQVRTGNAKDKQITPFLQDVKESTNLTKISNTSNIENVNNINLFSNNRIEKSIRNSATNFSTQNNQNILLQSINNTKNISNYNNIRLRKDVLQEQTDFKDIFNKLLKDLNLRNDVTNLYNREINLHSRNISFEFISQINQSFAKEYSTNIRNQTSVYNFYRSIENRYREFIQNLNFMNEIYQEFKNTEYKIRNNYQNVHQHNFLQKNQYNKSVINLTKEINFENNLVDYNFRSAILKTANKSNTLIQNNIEKIKESLNVVQNNVNYVNQKVSVLNYNTENKISNDIKNILNNKELSDEYSNIVLNKISNISNNTQIKKLLSVVNNEETLNSLTTLVRQSNSSIANIKQISEIINVTKNNNISSVKLSSEKISNVKNLLSLTESLSKNYAISNFSQVSKNFNLISQSILKTSNLSSVEQISNTIKQVAQIKIDETKIQKIIKLSKIENSSFLDLINIFTDNKIKQNIKKIRQTKNIDNFNEFSENFSILNQNKLDNQNVFKISNNSQVNKFIELLQNTKLDARTFTELKKLEEKNITSVLNVINSISPLTVNKYNNLEQVEKVIQSINNLGVTNFQNVINKTSNIKNLSEISNINLTKNDILNVVKLERQIKTYSEKVKIQETLKTLDFVESISKVAPITRINNSYSEIKKVSEFFENINLIKNEKNLNFVNRYSFDSNKKNITNLFSELNITSLIKSEKKTEKTFSSINKQIDRLYKMNERVDSKASKAEQSFFDLVNFSDYSGTKKTSTKKEIKNFFQTLNLVKVNNEQIKQKIKLTTNTDTYRITQNNERVKIDIHKQKNQNYYKVENISKFEKKSYYQEKQEKEAQEKVIENKVEELLVKKIQNVTNNITNNVITKQEINNIKQEIIREIFKVEEKYDQKILAIKQETRQTVQSMLSQFLKS